MLKHSLFISSSIGKYGKIKHGTWGMFFSVRYQRYIHKYAGTGRWVERVQNTGNIIRSPRLEEA